MKFKEPQKIILELLDLINETPITFYEIEKLTKRHYMTIKPYIDLFELLGFVKVEKIISGQYSKYEVTISKDGQKAKDRINEKRN